MSWKSDWYYLSGNLKVTVRAIDEEGVNSTFDFTCYVTENVFSYDRLAYLEDIANAMAKLQRYYQSEIIDIKEIKE